MSYFERLNAIKGQLTDKINSLQDTQDNLATASEEFLTEKVKNVAEKLEAVGGGGMLIMKGASGIKKLYNKYKGKESDEKGNEKGDNAQQEAENTQGQNDATDPQNISEPQTEGQTNTQDLTDPHEIQMEEIPELEPETAGASAEAEGELFSGLRRTTFVSTEEINANPEMFKSATKISRGEEVANWNDDQFEEARARTQLGIDDDTQGIGMRPVDTDVVNQARATANTAEITPATESGDMDSLYPMRQAMEANAEPSGRATMGQGEGLQETSTQQQIMDLDPEDAITSLNSGTTAGRSVGQVADEASSAVSDAVNAGGDALISAGGDALAGASGFLDGAMGVADAVLGAVPVVGEVALIATAVAGFFESIFGGHPKVPDAEILGDTGLDASAMVKQTPATEQV